MEEQKKPTAPAKSGASTSNDSRTDAAENGTTKAGQEATRGGMPERHREEHHSQYGGGGAHGGVKDS